MVSSFWFWADVFLGISGGLLVWWGLDMEKAGEKMLPPSDFRPDIFHDIVTNAKSKMDRGWLILKIGIVIEVVAAFGISVISGLEIADLTDKSAAAMLEAKQAGTNAAASYFAAKIAESNAAASNERAAKFDADRVLVKKEAEEIRSTNLVLQIKLQQLEARMQDRTITDENRGKFIKLLQYTPKGSVAVFFNGASGGDAQNYAEQIREMIGSAGFDVGSSCSMVWTSGQIPKEVGIGVNNETNRPPFAGPIQQALRAIGIDAVGYYDRAIGTNIVKIYVGDKP